MPKTPNVMGFSGSVNGTTKTQVFWILVFANVNGPSDGVLNNLALACSGYHSNRPANEARESFAALCENCK